MAIMLILFCSEFFSYMSTYETTEMYIDVDKESVRVIRKFYKMDFHSVSFFSGGIVGCKYGHHYASNAM